MPTWGCVDDAADLIQSGARDTGQYPAGSTDDSRTRRVSCSFGKNYPRIGPERDLYKDNLDDAIEGTRDAMNDAEKAKKKVAPPPIRRKN